MINVVHLDLKGDGEVNLKKYLRNRILALKEGWKDIHETRLPNWRRIYEAVPLEKVREFPWHNASNIVIPVVAIHADTLLSRLMAAIFKIRPIWVSKILGRHPDPTSMDILRESLEIFMEYNALEPQELDLYRVYLEWIGETIKYGTSTVKCPYETITEEFVTPAGEGVSRSYNTRTIYDGPRPEKIPFEDFFVPPSTKTLESSDIRIHRRRMEKWELEERRFKQVYKPSLVDEVLKHPDRTSPTSTQQREEQDAGAKTTAGYGYQEWDIYECWHIYRINEKVRTRLVCSYHLATDTLLRGLYSTYPRDPFVTSRLFFRDNVFPGHGFCEMLGPFQEEISQMHNDRRNNMVAALNFFRVNPDSKLHSGYRIFPFAMVPAEKDEMEAIKTGEPGPISIDEERLSLDLAERRSGVSPPQQGMGAGSFTKRGVYTAMGTLSLLQEGNNRTDLNVSDFRHSHTKLGRILAEQYAEFGIDADRFSMFGEQGERMKEALIALKEKRLALPIVPATASINREVEKQNDLMLTNVMSRHYGMITQMLEAAANEGLPPSVREYIGKAVVAANELMEVVTRHFGFDETERLVPEAKTEPTEGGEKGVSDADIFGQPQQGPPVALGAGGSPIPGVVV